MLPEYFDFHNNFLIFFNFFYMIKNLMADKLIITFKEYTKIVEKLAIQIHKNYKPTVLVGIMRGAAPIIDILSRILKLPTAYLVIQSYHGKGLEDKQGDLTFARDISSIAKNKDFERLAAVSEHNCLKMHSVMWTTRPSVIYWNEASLNCMHAIREMQKTGEAVFFTMDAGPQIKAVCLPENEAKIAQRLSEIKGVVCVMKSKLGYAPISRVIK